MKRLLAIVSPLLAFLLLVTACGSSKQSAAPASTAAATTRTATKPATTSTTLAAPGALQGEALSAAAGDIPDNQVFVRYNGPSFSMRVPEGWARKGSGNTTTFREK